MSSKVSTCVISLVCVRYYYVCYFSKPMLFYFRLDLGLCMPNLPLFVNICVTELWLSDVADITNAATNALKVL